METIKDILKAICEKVLSKNKFFDNGFYDTYYHEDRGLVLSNADNQYLNITDVKGNYFYLSYKPKATVTPGSAMSETGRTFNYSYDCSIVAVTEGMDELLLVNALMNTIGSALQNVNSLSTNVPFILSEELRPLKQEVINSTISKIGDRQVVKIYFTQKVQFSTQNCPIDPTYCCDDEGLVVPTDWCCVPAGGTVGQVLAVGPDGVSRVWMTFTGGSGINRQIINIHGNGTPVTVTVGSTDNTDYVYTFTGPNVTFRMPTAVGNKNLVTIIQNGTDNGRVIFTGSETCNGETEVFTTRQWTSIEFISNNTNYNL